MDRNVLEFVFEFKKSGNSFDQIDRFNLFKFIEEFNNVGLEVGVLYRCCVFAIGICGVPSDFEYSDNYYYNNYKVYDFEFKILDRTGQDHLYEGMYRELCTNILVEDTYILVREGLVCHNHLRFVIEKVDKLKK